MTDTVQLALEMRTKILSLAHRHRASHVGGALSVTDLLAVLYGAVLHFDPQNPVFAERDRLFYSKGHACLALYTVLQRCGFYSEEALDSFSTNGSYFTSHVNSKVPGIELSTGSLGHALGVACGVALAGKRRNAGWNVYAILSDGELDEGSNWEALLFAPHHGLNNLVVAVDYNKIQSFGSIDSVLRLEPLKPKLEAFGWHTVEVDGHDHDALKGVLSAPTRNNTRPTMIIAHTRKGKGVPFMEDQLAWHYKSPDDQQLKMALATLNNSFVRTAFINQLIACAREDDRIFLLVGDLGYSVVEPFRDAFPDRFLNAGIAEQNMTSVAAGLAMDGYNVFTYSIGNFPTLRCMEQIRYDVCYHDLSVNIVSVGGGYAYGPLGASHHTTEDIGMLRTIPNITVCAPGDPVETSFITAQLCKRGQPSYLRLGKAGETPVHTTPILADFGKILPVIRGSSTAVLSTGGMLAFAAEHIRNNALPWSLYSVPVIKPFDVSTLGMIAGQYEQIITLEEHQRSGGFGSAVLEALNDWRNSSGVDSMPRVRTIAIPDLFIGYAGTQEYLREQAGLYF